MAEAIRPITMPKWGIEMTEGTITGWTASVGQSLQKGEPMLEVETEKIVNSVEAPFPGTLRRILADKGDVRPVGALIAVFAESETSDEQIDSFVASFKGAAGYESAQSAAPAPSAAPVSTGDGGGDEARISPVARRTAEKLGVDISKVQGTGRNGRISKEDVEAYAARTGALKSDAATAAPARNEQTRLKMSATRSVIARRLLESKQSIPHYRLAVEIQAGALLARKRELAESARVTVNDLIVRACALALVKHPALNATLEGDEIVRYAHADIAIAVATDDGLITPIVRSADTKSISDIAKETASLAERARSNSLKREDITGGTFTISNLGMYKLERFDAIINPPQVAILAVGGAVDKVVARNGAAVVTQAMMLSLSADHRVVDGAVGAAFLVTLRDLLENPANL